MITQYQARRAMAPLSDTSSWKVIIGGNGEVGVITVPGLLVNPGLLQTDPMI